MMGWGAECDVPFWWYWKKIVPKKVLKPVLGKIGTGKSLGTGIGKIWNRKKVSELTLELRVSFCFLK